MPVLDVIGDTMIKERIILEHGPCDGYSVSVRCGVSKVVVPVLADGWDLIFEDYYYGRTERNSGAPEYRRIYTWVKQ